MRHHAQVINLNSKGFNFKNTDPVSELKRFLHDIKSPLQTLQIMAKGHLDKHEDREEIQKLCLAKINYLSKDKQSDDSSLVCLPNLFNEIKKVKSAELRIKVHLFLSLDRAWIKTEISKEELENILSNLINNSFNASSDNKQIIIKVTQTKNSTKVTLTDYGRGMKSNELMSIGTKGISHTPNGQGIGLNQIIRKLNLIGGSLFCRSLPQLGSQFTITLPY